MHAVLTHLLLFPSSLPSFFLFLARALAGFCGDRSSLSTLDGLIWPGLLVKEMSIAIDAKEMWEVVASVIYSWRDDRSQRAAEGLEAKAGFAGAGYYSIIAWSGRLLSVWSCQLLDLSSARVLQQQPY